MSERKIEVAESWAEEIEAERDGLLAENGALRVALDKANRLVAVYANVLAEIKSDEEEEAAVSLGDPTEAP